MQHAPPPDALQDRTFTLSLMDTSELGPLSDTLVALGYAPVPEVQDKGQFAIKGGIVDAWPVTEEWPLRIEFFGPEAWADEIQSAADGSAPLSESGTGDIRTIPSAADFLNAVRRGTG